MKWLLYLVTIFLIILTLLIITAFTYIETYADRFFPGVKINNQSLSKLSHAQAINLFQEQVDNFTEQGLTYIFNNQKKIIHPTLPATSDPDVSYTIISFDVPKTAEAAYLVGRKKGYRKNFIEQMWALIFGYNLALKFEFNQQEFLKILQNNLNQFITPKEDARPQIDDQLNITILAGKAGTTFDYQLILKQTLDRLFNLSNEPIQLNLITDYPQISENELSPQLFTELESLLATSTITFTYQKQRWPVTNQIFKDWFIFKKIDGQIVLGLEASNTSAYLEKEIAPAIYKETLDAKFEIKNGRVIKFQGSQDGQDLEIKKSINKIEEELFKNFNLKIELVANETKARITTASINDLGVSEIIGTGHSNFTGSPSNRRHNIAVGANTLNGVLIKPGEEFSLIMALGKVDASTGYKPELVIKGDETIPEYGGGLCQIGTTMFRAALASGLPITERKPHSYRVVYYEPAGKDATIYNPRPDLKFINDTPNYILIQSRIEGNDLYFDFWGTKDGRLVVQSDSEIYNIKSPGPTQYIETAELKPGETRCTERAHNGADAHFDYLVTYPNGEVKKVRFTSHYIPWPARCLIGKEPETATSTEEIIE